MTHKFVLMVNGVLNTYTRFEDIPEDFDHIIEFLPDIPDPPHTHAQHEEIDAWHQRLKDLIAKEKSRYGNS
jgi:hypothetical protein